MPVYLQSQGLEFLLIDNGGRLIGKSCEHYAADKEAVARKGVHETQQILVISDAEVASDLVLLYIRRIDRHDDLSLILELAEHSDLGVGFKPGKHSGGVIIVEQLAAELQIKLAAKLRNALSDVFRLCLEILVVIKSDLHG